MQHLLIIIAALTEGAREKRGADWCKRWGVGYARRRLGTPVRNVVEIVPSVDVSKPAPAHEMAADALQAICRECGECRMARE